MSPSSQAMFQEAMALHQQGQLAAAQRLYEDVLRLQPKNADALHLSGLIALQSKEQQKAADLIAKAIKVNPANAVYHVNHGIALKELRQPALAVASYDRAIALQPQYAAAHYSRGNALKELGRLEDAVASFDKAIALQPRDVLSHLNRGLALQELNQLDAAVASFDTAIAIDPGFAEAYFNKSLALLLGGQFDKGWSFYEWRWKRRESLPTNRQFSQPRWTGAQSLQGKTILLYSEQGLGDTLQFCRYAQAVAALGAHVILEVQAPLLRTLQGLAGVHHLIAAGAALPPFDYHCPLLSLPVTFKTDASSIYGATGYLRTDDALVAQWADKLGPPIKPRVGIVWSGNPGHGNDHNRSMTLAHMLANLPDNVELVSLQKELRPHDLVTLENTARVRHFGKDLQDFSDTAALCSLLDVVISVDTSVAHVSAALGLPTWILLPFSPDWRWLLNRTDSPWYASVRLYRQRSPGDWTQAFAELGADLDALTRGAPRLNSD